MNITSAQWVKNSVDPKEDPQSIEITVDGETMYVPKDPNNRHYEEVLKQVDAGALTIKDAD